MLWTLDDSNHLRYDPGHCYLPIYTASFPYPRRLYIFIKTDVRNANLALGIHIYTGTYNRDCSINICSCRWDKIMDISGERLGTGLLMAT
jgi:hypothetical protein